ncbi:MAG: hypothetical protein HY321_20340 [Armatimonadetes bacterium]|nr:hypothetical protein [Armatimonadota bacterium]
MENHPTDPTAAFPQAIDENASFLLLAHAHWRMTGREVIVTAYYPLIQRLARYLMDADTTGNGFPDVGVAGVPEADAADAAPRGEPVSLAVKTLAALGATVQIAARNGDDEFAAVCRDHAALIRQTLDSRAWLGDHYAVAIEKPTADAADAWDGESAGGAARPEWDAHSIRTSAGLLYPLMVGSHPDVDEARLARDIASATRSTLMEYGSTDSSADPGRLSTARNLWRDFVAGYLGMDYLDMAARYWAFEAMENSVGCGGGFVDAYGGNAVRFHPGGIAGIGAFAAAAGLSIDRLAGRVSLNPVRVPLRVPLLPLADWDAGAVPWLDVDLVDGEVRARILRRELLDGMVVTVFGKEIGALGR